MKPTTVSMLFFSLSPLGVCCNSESNSSMDSAQKTKESFIETKEVKLHYLDWGGTGEGLVLICGLGDTSYLFDDLAKKVSDHFHVIGYERRFHGQSIARGKAPLFDIA